jgi:hypothetical protein
LLKLAIELLTQHGGTSIRRNTVADG